MPAGLICSWNAGLKCSLYHCCVFVLLYWRRRLLHVWHRCCWCHYLQHARRLGHALVRNWCFPCILTAISFKSRAASYCSPCSMLLFTPLP